jgi:hypothetical protein
MYREEFQDDISVAVSVLSRASTTLPLPEDERQPGTTFPNHDFANDDVGIGIGDCVRDNNEGSLESSEEEVVEASVEQDCDLSR